ncbi:MAG: GNAT family N-acetyltransferase [Renibacterium salmoninarum]|nr:GNAT family N-acetyltransferase [Renibacterium salmoninarum]
MSQQPAVPLPAVPVLSDQTVRLRGIELRDAPELIANCRDPEAVRWTTVPLDYSADDAQQFITEICPQGWRDGSTQTFAIADAGSDRLLGTIDLHQFRAATAELGINVGRAARGSSAALRAVRLIQDYACHGLSLEYLYWQAYVPNWPSRKLAWKAGFRFEAELRGFAAARGVSTDVWLLSWAAGAPGAEPEPWPGPVFT